MPVNSTPKMAPGTLPRICASSAAFCATARAPRRTGFRRRRWPMPTTGTQAIRSRCAPSPPDRSVFSARSTRPMAATPAVSCCRPGSRIPTITACGKPMPMWSNIRSISSTTSPGSRQIPTLGDQFHQSDDRIYARRRGIADVQRGAVQLAEPNRGRAANPRRRHQCRSDQHVPSPVSLQHPLRSCERGQCRHLCREHDALDRLVADHAWLARRLFCGVGEFHAAAGKLGQS